jgi:hydroxymethylpyrimidine/phosphomethylpyrimidine kinase
VESSIVRGQIESVLSDMGAHALKIGMISTVELIHAVNATLTAHATSVHVIDPIGMVGGEGQVLSTEEKVEAVRAVLVPIATVLTPNMHAAGQLLGRAVPS